MNAFIGNSLYSMPAIAIGLLTLFLLEKKFPLRKPTQKLFSRLAVNLIMASITFLVAMTVVRPVSMRAIDWSSETSLGLLNAFEAPPWLNLMAGFLLLDLSFYYWHRLNHTVPLLWRFHNTHHIDPDLDVSTAFRFHFGEVAYSSLFRVVQVLIIAPDIFIFLSYEFVFQLATFFHHSNLRLPHRWDRFLKLIIVTPRMHGIHHSQYKNETNSNYSVVFSFWDRLHNTFRKNIPQNKIKIGVPGYASEHDNQLGNLLKAPFRSQKDYWLGKEKRD